MLNSVSAKESDTVILLHGIARTSKHMHKLEKYLIKDDFRVINVDYPSTRYSLERLAYLVHQRISKENITGKIHFVGYSMGGLLIRVILGKYEYPNLGRVVQLAPPNQGSEVADFIKNNGLYKKFYGESGQQLITDQTEIAKLLPGINYELGVIAGNRTIDPFSSLIIPGKDDGKVAVERTKISNMKDHVIIGATHTFFPSNKKVLKQTAYFLQNGSFIKENKK